MEMLQHGVRMVSDWGEGGQVLWLSLSVSSLWLRRASELFARSNRRVQKQFVITRRDMTFLSGDGVEVQTRIEGRSKKERGSLGSYESAFAGEEISTRHPGGPTGCRRCRPP